MTTTINTLNSVNIGAVGDLVSAIQDDSAKADTIWRSTVDWKAGLRSEAKSRDFAPIRSYEPVGLGGEDTALGIELKSLGIELPGDLDQGSIIDEH